MANEARRRSAVSDAMVIGETQRRHQAELGRHSVPNLRHRGSHHPENCDFRVIDNRRERRVPPSDEIVKVAPRISAGVNFRSRAFADSVTSSVALSADLGVLGTLLESTDQLHPV